jgi:hypothetical protein
MLVSPLSHNSQIPQIELQAVGSDERSTEHEMRMISQVCTCFCRTLLALFPLIATAPSIAQSGSSAGQTVVFEQPNLNGIAGNLHVPKAEYQYPTEHILNLLLWQPNPISRRGTGSVSQVRGR